MYRLHLKPASRFRPIANRLFKQKAAACFRTSFPKLKKALGRKTRHQERHSQFLCPQKRRNALSQCYLRTSYRLELDIHRQAQAAASLQRFTQETHVGNRLIRPVEISNFQFSQFFGGQLLDAPAASNNAAELCVVTQHKLSIDSKPHVKLYGQATDSRRRGKGLKRVFGREKSCAAVRNQRRQRPRCAIHFNRAWRQECILVSVHNRSFVLRAR